MDRMEAYKPGFVEALAETARLARTPRVEAGLETELPLAPIGDWLRQRGRLGEQLAGLVPETRGDLVAQLAALSTPSPSGWTGQVSRAIGAGRRKEGDLPDVIRDAVRSHPSYPDRLRALDPKGTYRAKPPKRGEPAKRSRDISIPRHRPKETRPDIYIGDTVEDIGQVGAIYEADKISNLMRKLSSGLAAYNYTTGLAGEQVPEQ
jgi:hypothetical protein